MVRRKSMVVQAVSSFASSRNEMAWLTDDASLLRPPCPRSTIALQLGWSSSMLLGVHRQENARGRNPPPSLSVFIRLCAVFSMRKKKEEIPRCNVKKCNDSPLRGSSLTSSDRFDSWLHHEEILNLSRFIFWETCDMYSYPLYKLMVILILYKSFPFERKYDTIDTFYIYNK